MKMLEEILKEGGLTIHTITRLDFNDYFLTKYQKELLLAYVRNLHPISQLSDQELLDIYMEDIDQYEFLEEAMAIEESFQNTYIAYLN